MASNATAVEKPVSSRPGTSPGVSVSLKSLPLHFEVNQGQAGEEVKFLARTRGSTVLLTSEGAVLRLVAGAAEAPPDRQAHDSRDSGSSSQRWGTLGLRFLGGNGSPLLSGVDELPGKVNYFRGSEPAKWRTNVVTYAKVRYEQVYPGIDVLFYGNGRQLEFDCVVAPGADPSAIVFSLDGAEHAEIDGQGNLLAQVAGQQVVLYAPSIHQMAGGERRQVFGRFVGRELPGSGRAQESASCFGFELGAYDTSQLLVIDPVLSYSTYLGGSDFEQAFAIAIDPAGNAYVTGRTRSIDFPTSNALQGANAGFSDGFVTKLSPTGALIYSTYFGGSDDDDSRAIAVDIGGSAYVTGSAGSTDFPTTPGAFQTGGRGAFIAKLSPDGSSLVFSTYLRGGTGSTVGNGIALDAANNVYVTGWTTATDFPMTNAVQSVFGGSGPLGVGDAFVVKMNATGTSLLYSTYLGGDQDDFGEGIAVDADRSAYIRGITISTNYPTSANAFQTSFKGQSDAFVSKLDSNGGLIYSTYLGGSGVVYYDFYTRYGGIAVDRTGNAYVTGQTSSKDFPTKNAYQPTSDSSTAGFVTKLSPTGSALVYSTYLGGVGGSAVYAIAVDAAGCAYVTGCAASDGLPIINPLQPEHGGVGWEGAFVTKFDPDGASLVYSTFLGGNSNSPSGLIEMGTGIAIDAAGNAFIAGFTQSTNFMTTNAFQTTYGGGSFDAFAARITADLDTAPPRLVFAGTGGGLNAVEVIFSEPLEQGSATNPNNFALDNGVAVTAAAMGRNSRTVQLTTSTMLPGVDYVLTVNNVQDRAPTPNTIVTNSQIHLFTFPTTNGVITRKVFNNIPGTLLEELTTSAKFPNLPDSVDYLDRFESSTNIAGGYGIQLQGYVIPPVSGEYTFYFCAGDVGQLFLSNDSSAANKVLIASEPEGNPPGRWVDPVTDQGHGYRGNPPANISAPIHLDAGGRYYLEALMKKGEGFYDYLGVAWHVPGTPPVVNYGPALPGQYLLSRVTVGPPVIIAQAQSVTVGELQLASFTLQMDGSPPFTFQWLKNGLAIPGATNIVFSMPAALSDSGAGFSIEISNPLGSVTSSNAVLVVVPKTSMPSLLGATNLTLEIVEVVFSEPINGTTATNLANYSISAAQGGLAVLNAALAADRATVILTTDRQNEGTQYTLTVNGIRDTSVAGNPIAADSQAKFTPSFPNEFVGPFSSWADVKRDFGATGDGVTDDTAQIQRALDSIGISDQIGSDQRPAVLYFPAGTYRITAGLEFFTRLSASVFGEDPANTTILWDGATNGVMLWLNGVSLSRIGRFTFDGRGSALSGIDQKWDGQRQFSTTGNEYADMIFKDLVVGIRGGDGNVSMNDDAVAMLRCHFLRCSQAGARVESFNALNWWFWNCVFEDCREGVSNWPGAGNFLVYDSLFLRSTETDVKMDNTAAFFSVRNNVSIGSQSFFLAEFTGNAAGVTLQGNVILDPKGRPVDYSNFGPLLLLDNVIRSRADAVPPVIRAGTLGYGTNDVVSVGNTFTLAPSLVVDRQFTSLDDQVVERTGITPVLQVLPETPPNLKRPVFDIPKGAGGTVIQQAIDAAAQLNGQRPVIHLPAGTYPLDRTLVVPAGSDLQLVGDGRDYATVLDWIGTNAGPMLWLVGPARAILRDFTLRDQTHQAYGIVADECDQVGARIYGDQVEFGAAQQHDLLVQHLDHALIELHAVGLGTGSAPTNAGITVIGGPLQSSGQPAEGRVSIFGGSGGGEGIAYDVQEGGRLLACDMWLEGYSTEHFLRLTGSGTLTLHGINSGISYENQSPTLEISNFLGQVSFLEGGSLNTDILVAGEGEHTRVLALGLISGIKSNHTNYFADFSPNAEVDFLHNRVNSPADPGSSPAPDYKTTSSEPEFLRAMLSQTRMEQPQPLTKLPPGITDVQLHRVSVVSGLIGMLLKREVLNSPPVLAPIEDRTVQEGDLLTVVASATDTDLPPQTLNYSLALGAPDGMSIEPTTGVISWTPSEAQGPGTYLITVRVTDNGTPPMSATNSFTVVVNELNTAPVLTVPATQTINELATLSVSASATDSDIPVNPLTFALVSAPPGMTINPDSGLITWTPSQAQSPTTNLVQVSVTDANPPAVNAKSLSVTNSFMVIVREVNVAPVLPVIGTQTVNEMVLLTVTNTASEANVHATVGYALVNPPAGMSIDGSGVITWTPSEAQGPGTNVITTVAASTDLLDLANLTLSATNSFTVVVNEVNTAPVLTVPATQTINELATLSVSVSATDSDIPANPLTFALVSAPTGMTINPNNGLITWTPSQAQSPSTNLVQVSVTDTNPPAVNAKSLSVTNSFTVTVREVNQAPVLLVIATQTVNELTLLTVTNTAMESNIHSTLGYALVGPSAGMAIDANGIITWMPQQNQSPSTNLITTLVTNSNPYDLVNPHLSATNAFTVIVKEVNVAPVLPVIAAQTVNELTLLTVTNTATESNIHSALGYALVGPPVGMGIDANGVITWTPQQNQSPGTNLITTIVTNSNPYDLVNSHLSATNTFTVIVKEVNVAPVLPVIPTQTVNELTLVTVTNTATESNIHSTLGYALVSPPAGMSIGANGVITWTPQQNQSPGTNLITTIATNSNPYDLANPHLTATNTFTVIVNEVNVAPVLPVIATQTVNEQTLLTVTNTATESNIHSTLGYALVGPSAGMAIDANGIITWMPQQNQSPSTNLITTIVTNTNPYDLVNPRLSATNTFSVIVKEVNVAPVLAVIATQIVNELVLLTVTNAASEANMHATVGYALVSPPAGMSIDANGVITWTPGEAQGPGTNVITTVATSTDLLDLANPTLSTTNSFTVVVNEVNTAPVLTVPATQTINELATFSVSVSATDSDIPANPLTFALVSAPTGMTINPNSGLLTWTPSQAQSPSTNLVQVSVTDTNPPAVNAKSLSVTNSFTVIVREVNQAPMLPDIATQTVNELALLTVTNTATESNIHSMLGYTLVNPPAGMSINADGVITWTPSEAQGPGTNVITTVATSTDLLDLANQTLSASNSFTVVVNEVNTAPVIGAINDLTVNPGQSVGLAVPATDSDLPTNSLAFALLASPPGMTLNAASGWLAWRPTMAQANTTNLVNVQVTDDNPWAINAHQLSATQSFWITVNPLTPVTLQPLGYTNDSFLLSVRGPVGPDYILQGSPNLQDWLSLASNAPLALPFTVIDTNTSVFTNRFYRVRLGP